MVWIIIVVILLVAFGPLLWLMPSHRERRLAKLRQRAYSDGMRVELRRMPKQNLAPEERVSASGKPLDLTRECAAYIYPLPARLRMLPKWRVLRGDDGVPAYPGWVFDPGGRPDHPRLREMLEVLAPVVEGLPDDVVAVEAEPQNLAAYWLEGPGATPEKVGDLGSRLAVGASQVTELDRRLRAETEGGNI
ncbi:MAG: hypothetical protein ACNA7W_13785 [Pseudomonadales bacterium]